MLYSRNSAYLIGGVAWLATLAATIAWRAGLPSQPPRADVLPAPEPARLIFACIEAKSVIIVRLLDNEIGLLEAAAGFCRLNDALAELVPSCRRDWPGCGRAETACRQVIAWVRSSCLDKNSPTQTDLTTQRFARELDELLAAGGSIELP